MRTALKLLGLVAVLLLGGRAFAHGQLVASDPPAGAIVAEAPAAVELTFSEPVSPLAFRWFPPDGDAVDVAPSAEGARIAVPLPAGGGAGTFLLSWRVASGDGHPVGGSLAFSVGAPSPVARPVAERPAWAAAAGRGLLTLALVFGVGGALFLRAVEREAAPPPRARRLALWMAAAVTPAALLASGLHGLDLLDAPAAALLGPGPWAAAVASPFARSAAAGVLAAIAAVAALRRQGTASAALALVAWGLAATSFALFGHAATASPRWLTAPAVAIHAGAFIFWIGALPALAERAATDRRGLAPSLRRFSAVAMPLVGLLVLSGGLLAIAQVRDPAALLGTAYGRLLVAKVLLVLPLLGLAALNRFRLTPAIARGGTGAAMRFRRSVHAEIVVAIAIVALASGFRLFPPPRALTSQAAAELHAHLHAPTLMADLALAPGRPGQNTIALTLHPAAPPPREIRIAFAAPAAGVEPIRLVARPDGTTWSAGPLLLPRGGEWQVTVDVRIDDFDQMSLRTTVQLPDH